MYLGTENIEMIEIIIQNIDTSEIQEQLRGHINRKYFNNKKHDKIY